MRQFQKASKQINTAVKLLQLGVGVDENLCRFIRNVADNFTWSAQFDYDAQKEYHKKILMVILSELKTRPVEEVTRNLERLIREQCEND